MVNKSSFGLALAIVLQSGLGVAASQTPASRVAGDWGASEPVTIPASRPPLHEAAADLGAAPPDARLDRMILLLAPSAEQREALNSELAGQQNPASPEYHRWLGPAAFADAFANSKEDVASVAAWLRMQGFEVAALPAGRGWIEFSGNVAEAERAFHVQIHTESTQAGPRAVLAGDISVPGALAPLIEGLISLDGAVSTALLAAPSPVKASAAELAAETSIGSAEALTPRLLDPLLHLDVLHDSGVTGAGESIAIAARSNVHAGDVTAFRAAFGLPANPLALKLDGRDPGRNGDEAEAVFAASWAGAAAPGARIVLVPAATTSATDGVDLSLAAIVDQSLAHTVAVGFSACEAALSRAHQAFYAAVYRQAAAEGIAVIAAAGDSGPAACSAAGGDAPVTSGFGVNALASTPWDTAAGVAALSGGTIAAWSPATGAEPARAGGGGRSELYNAPAWQPVPSSREPKSTAGEAAMRLLPDVALPAAIDTATSRGLAFCLSGETHANGCSLVRSGGSSASAALFAGIAALVAQKYGPQGNVAQNLYPLSRVNGVFTDITQGGARLRCAAGSPGCEAGGQIGYNAGEGFDLATGLGMVNAAALASQWTASPQVGTGLANVENTIGTGQTINPSGSIVLSAKVVSETGGSAPTGTVAFFDQSTGTNIAQAKLVKSNALVSTASVTLTGVLTQGGHPIAADYSGDANYAAANSQPVVVEVEPSTTSITVTPATRTPTAGSLLSVTAAITSLNAGQGASPPSGTVDFRLNGVSQGVKPVIPGSPSTSSTVISVPGSAGSYQIVCFYSGDPNYTNSTSEAASITVPKSATTVTVTPATTTPIAGSSLVVTATIGTTSSIAAAPSGTVTFTLDGTGLGSAMVITGTPSTAAITITVPSNGTHTLAAVYSGDGNYDSSNSAGVPITVAKSPTTLTVTPATTTPAPGSIFKVTAALSALYPGASAATGTVTFTLDGATQGSAPVVAGSGASLNVTAPATGTHTLQASYGGDANYSGSTSGSVTVVVTKAPTTTVLTPATLTPAAGSSLLLLATITPTVAGPAQPTGSVAFTMDGTALGTEPVVAGSTPTSSITVTSLSPGTHLLLGTYSGDTYYAGSVAAGVTITVSKSPTTTVVTPATLTPAVGTPLQVTAAISAARPGSALPSGTVSFTLDGVAQGNQAVTAGSPSSATINLPIAAAGTHLLAAAYSGDAYYATSNSAAVSLTVAKGATVTTLMATPALLAAGTPETLTATVAPAGAVSGTTYTITGTVTFYDGGSTLLGKAALSSNVAALSGITLANNANHSITAVYSGDSNWLTDVSAPLLLASTTQPVTVVLAAGAATVLPGQPSTLVATVTPTSMPAATAEQNPSGKVIFYNGTTILGTVALTPSSVNDSAKATLTLTLPGGEDTLTALYMGDLYYDAALSNALKLDVEDFTITPAPSNPPTNLTIVQGSSGTASFVVTGLGGFNDQVQVVCAVPSQDDMTCSATPQQVTPTATVTFVVQTFSSGTALAARPDHSHPFWPRAGGGTALALLGIFLLPVGRRARALLGRSGCRCTMLFLVLAALCGTGIGCGGSSTPVGSGTPLGVATLKITAAAYIDNAVYSHSVYLTVNVIPKS
jgi:hypothetical protein